MYQRFDRLARAGRLILHIDLNSCFASIEQQARPMLRGRPVVITNRLSKNSMIITASYEAKALGVRVGMRRIDAQKVCPDVIFVESEASKYRYVFHKLQAIMRDYSPKVVMKSIDEGVIDLTESAQDVRARGLDVLAAEIKHRLRTEVGCAMRCNIGIASNQFLAKTAAGLHKPDGFDVVDETNLIETYGQLKLRDLCGIGHNNVHRLNAVGIYTPLEFLQAERATLEKLVFGGIEGSYWYDRLRGLEVDDFSSGVKSIGRQYVLERFDISREEIFKRLHNLAEDVGSKLRRQELVARGVYLWMRTLSGHYWHRSYLATVPFFSDTTIAYLAREIFNQSPEDPLEIGVTLYKLQQDDNPQMSIFFDEIAREQRLSAAIDEINLRFGARVVHSAATIGTHRVKVKVPFGSTRYL